MEEILRVLKENGFSGELSKEEAEFIYEFLEEEQDSDIKQ